MKKINAIFSEKMSKALLPIKTRKVMSAIDAALLNAEDDLQTGKLKYEEALAKLPTTDSISGCINDALEIRKKIKKVTESINELKELKAELEAEVEIPEVEE